MPQKIYRREDTIHESYSDHCRLCETRTESRRLVRIFSATGSKKDWQTKISKTCGVMIAEEDYLPKVICRKCGIFIEKMFEFIQTCKTTQVTLTQHYGMEAEEAHSLMFSENKMLFSENKMPFSESKMPFSKSKKHCLAKIKCLLAKVKCRLAKVKRRLAKVKCLLAKVKVKCHLAKVKPKCRLTKVKRCLAKVKPKCRLAKVKPKSRLAKAQPKCGLH